MTETQLEEMLTYAKAVNDTELAYKTFFHLTGQSKSQEKLKIYKLDLADYCFEQKDYEKALMAYDEFAMLYPGCTEIDYVQYKSILCAFLLSLSFDRDQTGTQRVISMCLLFFQKAKNEKLLEEAKNMYTSCRQRLFDHEVYVLETYLKLLKFNSAAKRIEYIEKEFKDIANLPAYIQYFNDTIEIVKNPKTRPFLIRFNLKHVFLDKEKRQAPSRIKKVTSFFLG